MCRAKDCGGRRCDHGQGRSDAERERRATQARAAYALKKASADGQPLPVRSYTRPGVSVPLPLVDAPEAGNLTPAQLQAWAQQDQTLAQKLTPAQQREWRNRRSAGEEIHLSLPPAVEIRQAPVLEYGPAALRATQNVIKTALSGETDPVKRAQLLAEFRALRGCVQ